MPEIVIPSELNAKLQNFFHIQSFRRVEKLSGKTDNNTEAVYFDFLCHVLKFANYKLNT